MTAEPLTRTLSETEYLTRRGELSRDLSESRERAKKAHLQLVQGDLADAEVDDLEAEVTKLEKRLEGLDTAWAESERIFDAANAAAHKFARSAAIARIRDEETKRLEKVRLINDAILALAPIVDEIFAHEAAMMAELDPFRHDLPREEASELTRSIRSHSREAEVVRGSLGRSGLERLGVVPSGPLSYHAFESIAPWRKSIQDTLDRLEDMD